MELWWWIEPMLITGLVGLFLAFVITLIFSESDSKILLLFVCVLCTPLAVGVLSSGIWFLGDVLYDIWSPYI